MAESVRGLPDEIQDLIVVNEWDMRTIEGARRCLELRAKSMPAIAMDGVLVYQSLIPGQEELCEEVLRRYHEHEDE